jgi:hypothetical protein
MNMSDSLPENSFSGILRVIKLTSGEEVIGLVSEAMPDKIAIKLPAKLENFMQKDSAGNLIECIKLSNYLTNIRGQEIAIPRDVIIYMGQPALDLEKMYDVYFMTMQTDPKSIISSAPEDSENNPEFGLQLLNDLFNNEDFVNFVNDLIETFEGVEIVAEDEDEGTFEQESVISDPNPQEPESPPQPKKRPKMKPERKSLPYKPDGDPNKAESWPDDPTEYFN